MDHLLVAGHPNYRPGDSPLVAPGLVVGFRQMSGIRRILTNAPIVAGGSGGPVLDRSGTVVGIAVTGAERLGVVSGTEDLGIVPIDALDILLDK
jgi:S1-C subfamily serine protease